MRYALHFFKDYSQNSYLDKEFLLRFQGLTISSHKPRNYLVNISFEPEAQFFKRLWYRYVISFKLFKKPLKVQSNGMKSAITQIFPFGNCSCFIKHDNFC
jgi:hypothetical protein